MNDPRINTTESSQPCFDASRPRTGTASIDTGGVTPPTGPLPKLLMKHTPGFILKPYRDFPEECYRVFYSELPELWFTFEVNMLPDHLCTSMDCLLDWEFDKEPDPIQAIAAMRDRAAPTLIPWLTDCITVLNWAKQQHFPTQNETSERG